MNKHHTAATGAEGGPAEVIQVYKVQLCLLTQELSLFLNNVHSIDITYQVVKQILHTLLFPGPKSYF